MWERDEPSRLPAAPAPRDLAKGEKPTGGEGGTRGRGAADGGERLRVSCAAQPGWILLPRRRRCAVPQGCRGREGGMLGDPCSDAHRAGGGGCQIPMFSSNAWLGFGGEGWVVAGRLALGLPPFHVLSQHSLVTLNMGYSGCWGSMCMQGFGELQQAPQHPMSPKGRVPSPAPPIQGPAMLQLPPASPHVAAGCTPQNMPAQLSTLQHPLMGDPPFHAKPPGCNPCDPNGDTDASRDVLKPPTPASIPGRELRASSHTESARHCSTMAPQINGVSPLRCALTSHSQRGPNAPEVFVFPPQGHLVLQGDKGGGSL